VKSRLLGRFGGLSRAGAASQADTAVATRVDRHDPTQFLGQNHAERPVATAALASCLKVNAWPAIN
jgi:hypothetical protein